MPEGPEVKRLVDSLEKILTGKKLVEIKILSGRYKKHGLPPGFAEFSQKLPAKISKVSCKGKFIYVIFSNSFSMWNTLGMSGGWSKKKTKHTRAELVLENCSVYFNDMRNFGTIKFTDQKQDLFKKLNSLGPDMLSENVEVNVFIERVRKKNSKTVVEALMDQKVVSGVGNYLKSEALYHSGISPHKKVSELTELDLTFLCNSVKETMRSSYKFGGSTFHTFSGYNGEVGEYTRRFAVYNQKTDPNGETVLKEKTKDGRTTHWVPSLQK
jgi:DNA-formamidopyrimidine glycosylase